MEISNIFTTRSLLLFFFSVVFLSSNSVLCEEPISPLPKNINADDIKAKLGKKLFFDKRLSIDNTVSCSTCHILESGGAEKSSVSTGVKGLKGERNSPTVYNTAYNISQFWDGRAHNLQSQAILPLTNPVEMGMKSIEDLVDKLKKTGEYDDEFNAVYGVSINAENLSNAIAEFEKTLITVNSPFDRYLEGNKSAITKQQKRGYELFKSYGCVACHQGKNVGGNMYQKLGVLKDINLQSGTLSKDLGRYNVTGNEWDKRVFKVPSLRLAVLTAPYFHDGSVATIQEAVDIMIQFQLGRDVPEQDKTDIISFLSSLAGEFPKGALQ